MGFLSTSRFWSFSDLSDFFEMLDEPIYEFFTYFNVRYISVYFIFDEEIHK